MKQNLLVTGAFVLTFAAGVLTGAFLVREFAAPRPRFEHGPRRPGPGKPQRPPFDLKELQERLELNEEQRQQVAAVLAKYRGQIERHFREVRQPVDELMRQMRGEIEQILTPEQREKFRQPPPRFGRQPPPPFEDFGSDSTLRP